MRASTRAVSSAGEKGFVHLLRPGREHDDTDTQIGGPDTAAHLEAVDAGQHDVQQGHPDIRVLLQLFQGLLAALGLDNIVARPAQIDNDKAADAAFIL